MLFNSFLFILLFLPIIFTVYFYFNKKRWTEASKVFLVVSSLFFYSWWNPIYLPLMLGSIVFNYVLGTLLIKNRKHSKPFRRQLLIFGIVVNVGLLGTTKYSDFFISNMNSLFDSNIPLLHLVLPLAISFFTFQQVAYLVDSYKGVTKEYDFMNYAIFVTFFPQLIAGPIVHHKEMMSQLTNIRGKAKNHNNITLGCLSFR